MGNFGSGLEMYIFKVPGTESYLSGDINKDKKVDDQPDACQGPGTSTVKKKAPERKKSSSKKKKKKSSRK